MVSTSHPSDPATLPAPEPSPAVESGRTIFWLVWVGSWMLRLLVLTLRVRVELPEHLRKRTAEPYIFVFWHNRLLLIPVMWQRVLQIKGRPHAMAMTSLSNDGELVALFLERFRIGAVRGSATRRGASALRELAKWLKRGHDIGITPDGSRGPCYELKPGLVLLAQLSGCAILPLSFEYSSAWRLKSWDRFFIPKPFSTIRFIAGQPHLVKRTSSAAEFESERLRCERMLCDQVREQ